MQSDGWTPEAAGISSEAVARYVEEQIYSLPGVAAPQQSFTVLLTGSRATGTHRPTSDVDLDVLCPQAVYEAVHRASLEAGIITSATSFFAVRPEDDWERYFGGDLGRPHFSLVSLEDVSGQLREFEDVPLWIFTNAKVLSDPGGQFARLIADGSPYPRDVLVRKIKYRWLLAAYHEVEVYPHHHGSQEDLLAASAAVLNAISDLVRVFFLVEGRPFPYAEKLLPLAPMSRLGLEFLPFLQRVVNLVLGVEGDAHDAWSRLDAAIRLLSYSDRSEDCRRLEEACGAAMIAAGVEPEWVAADFDNIDELLTGKLGPVP